MSSLTSLLVRDQRVTVRKIEEAIQRQVIVGGALDTVLLELGVLPEDVMAAYCAAVHGLLPATRDEVMRVPRDSIRLVPREVAERHRLVPLSLENGTLVVAVTAPLEGAVEEQLAFLLGVELVQRIVVEGRLAAALHHHYGTEMSPRLRRLTEKLRARDPGVVPFVAPPEPNLVERAASGSYAAVDDDDDDDEPVDGGTQPFVAVAPPASNEASVRVGVAQIVGVRYGSRPPPAPATDVSRPAIPGPAALPGPAPLPAESTSTESPSEQPSVGTSARSSVPPPSRTDARERVRSPRVGREGAPDMRRASVPRSDLLRRHRGPITARRAVQLLSEAPDRDTILEIAFAFARQFFDTTALFVVHEDLAEAVDVVGPGTPFDDARRPGVSLDEPGAFALVREGIVPLVTHLDQSDVDRALRAELGREDAMPAVLVPIAIRQRVVLVLYGDRSGDDFGLSDVPELLAFAPRLSEAFQKLILKLKRGPTDPAPRPAEMPSAIPAPAAKRWSAPPPEDDARWSTPPEPSRDVSAPSSSTPSPASTSTSSAPSSVASEAPSPSSSSGSLPAETDGVTSSEAARRRRPRKRSEAFEVLGIPREAPPPPVPGAMPDVVPRPSSSSSRRPDATSTTSPGMTTSPGAAAEEATLPGTTSPGLVEAGSVDAGPTDALPSSSTSASSSDASDPSIATTPGMLSSPGTQRAIAREQAAREQAASSDPIASEPIASEPIASEPEDVVVGVPAADADARAADIAVGVPVVERRDTDRAPPPVEATVEPSVEASSESVDAGEGSDADDDEPDIEVTEATSDEVALVDEAVRPRRRNAGPAGSYRMRGGVEEVVFSSRRKEPRRDDPRREDGSSAPAEEVVRLEGITPVASRATLAPSSSPPPRPSLAPGQELPSVIVEMDESVEALVGDLRDVGPEDEANAVTAVVALGEVALPVLVRDFPGPLWFDRHRPHRRLPRGRDVSAVARAIVAFGDRAVPYVGSLLDRDDVEIRFYATLLASELPHRDLVAPLGRRVFDDDGKVAALALDVLSLVRSYEDEMAEVLQLLRATARVPRYPAERRARAAHALGELRDVEALDLLVALLEAHEDVLAEAAHGALVTLTRQDFGMDPDRWDPWIETNKPRHRIEWLIDGLLHADEELRRAAGEELKHLTQEYYGYHPALPKRDREVAQRKYRRWWEAEGHQRFAS
jgi:hypothetical protein